MQTVRQIERLWNARLYAKLFRELLANRPENTFQLGLDAPTAALAAAMGIIRLDELNQPQVPLNSTLLRAVIACQEKDGGWGDAAVTTLCLHLMTGRNTGGEAIARGLSYLASLQKTDGLWPKVPLRRMPGDACVSAFILYELGDDERFRAAVHFSAAANWFAANDATLDADVRRLWDRAQLRCQTHRAREPMLVWS